MTNILPSNPNIAFLKKQAKQLFKDNQPNSLNAVSSNDLNPSKFGQLDCLRDAQLLIARQYGFQSWQKLSEAVKFKRQQYRNQQVRGEILIRLACGRACGKRQDLKARRANLQLRHRPELGEIDLYTALVAKNPAAVKQFLGANPELRHQPGGPLKLLPIRYIQASKIRVPSHQEQQLLELMENNPVCNKFAWNNLVRLVNKSRWLLTVFLISVVTQIAYAQNDVTTMPLVVDVPANTEFNHVTNVVYKKDKDQTLLADIFTPKTGDALPGIIFVHGGPLLDPNATKPKDWTFYQNYGALATQNGMAGIIFNHRMNSLTDFVTPQQDINDLYDYVQNHAAEYSIDKNKLCVWFFSGGGNFVAGLLKQKPDWLQCVAVYYGVMGMETFKDMGNIPIKVDDPELYDPLPVLLMQSDWRIPLFIAQAGKDNPGINHQLNRFLQAAMDNGWPVEYWNHHLGQHGFDILNNDNRSKLIIKRTMTFLQESM